jgi:hypothetical protein
MFLPDPARAPEIDQPHPRSRVRNKKDVFGFHVAMNKTVRVREGERLKNLTPDRSQVADRNRLELVRPHKVVKILSKNFKNRANVAPPNKFVIHADNMGGRIDVVAIQLLDNCHLGGALEAHLRGIDNDFESDRGLDFVVIAIENLTEGALPKDGLDFITIGDVIARKSPIMMSRRIKSSIVSRGDATRGTI